MKKVLLVALFFICFPTSSHAEEITVKIYAGKGDGYTIARNYENNWDELHDRTTSIGLGLDTEGAFYTGDSDIYVQTSRYFKFGRWSYVAVRPVVPFDTSEIPDNADITSAYLNLHPSFWKDGSTTIHIVESSQQDVNQVLPSDYSRVGAIDNPATGGVFSSNSLRDRYLKIPLNNIGLSWLSRVGWTKLGLRTENDALDIPPVSNNGSNFYSSEAVGSDKDPYLEITYTIPDEEDEYPLYTQIESIYPSLEATGDWEDDTFAYGSQEWCGDTIGGCGCAITSGVMAGRNAGITTDVTGDDVNPKNINEYLRTVGGYTTDGSVYWLAMQAYFGELTSEGKLSSRFKYVGKFEGGAVPQAASDYLATAGEYAVLAFKNSLGHFVWLPAKTGSGYVVRDPFWYLTNTSNDTNGENVKNYNDTFNSLRVFEILDEAEVYDGYGVEAYVKGAAELLYRDVVGNEVGYTGGGTVVNISGSSYGNAEVIGLNGTPAPGNSGKHLLVSDAENQFTIDVIGTGSGEFEVEFFTISETGEVNTFVISGQTIPGVTITFSINLETGEVTEEPISYEQFLNILESTMRGYADQQRKFFLKWAEKIYETMDEKTVSQALQSIEVYKKLLVAKKVESPTLISVVDLLSKQIK